MKCVSCGSQNIEKFQTETAIHLHSHDMKAPLVLVFPSVLVCMNCGKLDVAEEFVVPDDELRQLLKRAAACGA
jgi:hypothetical protein